MKTESTLSEPLRAAYRYWRQQPSSVARRCTLLWTTACPPAHVALTLARADVEAGRSRYPAASLNPYNPEGETGGRWIESTEAAGLRFVGWSDKLAKLDHTGWYTAPDDWGGEVYRGAVYQLPSRKGEILFVPGYREGSTDGNGNWSDTCSGKDSGVAILFFRDVHRETAPDHWSNLADYARDAAYRADRLAELAAERERDYQEAWRAGQRYSDLGEDLDAQRKRTLPLFADMKGLRPGSPAMAAVRAALAQEGEKRAAMWRERRELLSNVYSGNADAFAEGAGLRREDVL